MQSKLDYPIAAQPYNYGYRMMIGPLSLENAQLALSELNRRGYRDALLKFYSKSKLPKRFRFLRQRKIMMKSLNKLKP